MKSRATEKELDTALDEAFKSSPAFSNWFLSKTKFRETQASYTWSRSNHPWSPVPINILNAETGKTETVIKESETDILVVFETPDLNRFALHIENKIEGGKFTPLQPELYLNRAALWLNNPKFGNYKDFETVLVAPNNFYKNSFEDAKKFDRFISHEEIADFIPLFKAA